MVSTTVTFVAVVVFAFVAGRTLERFSSRLLFVSGVGYIALGVVLGPVFPPRLLSTEVLAEVDLFVSTLLGVIGFLSGLGLRRVQTGIEPTLAGLAASSGIIATVALAVAGTVQWLDPALFVADPVFSTPLMVTDAWLLSAWLSPEGLVMGLTVGAAAGSSSAELIEAAVLRFGVSPRRAELLRAMARTSEVLAVFCFGMAMAGSRATASAGALGLTLIEWSVIMVAAGGITGLLFSVFLGQEDDEIRTTVASVGVVVFSAGVGSALGVSPLFLNLMAGMTVALTSPYASRLSHALEPLRVPTTVLVLLLAGATWIPTTGWYWALIPGYAVLRWLTRRAFSAVAVATFVSDRSMRDGIGNALLAQGALASAISVAFAQRFPELAGAVTSTILGGMVLSDIFAFRSMKVYLADVGEVQTHPSQRGESL